jgi:lipopolysaccharide transport system ATP-binding protein
MNGAILGMTKAEITRKLDEIVDFSGCERYIDTPVKRYSSGMMVRLGFAVAAHLDPEILVVDEVLAVGDVEFQKKAIGKMQDVSKGEGRTVLFVSHNMQSVRKLCRSGVVLKNGQIDFCGTADDCIDYYVGTNLVDLFDYSEITERHHMDGVMREMEYLSVRMLNDCHNIANEEPLRFVLKVKRNDLKIDHCQFGVVIRNNKDEVVGAMYSRVVQLPKKSDRMEVELDLSNHQLAKGRYSLNFNISYNDYNSVIRDLDVVWDVIRFEVTYRDNEHTQPFTMWHLGNISYSSVEPQIRAL